MKIKKATAPSTILATNPNLTKRGIINPPITTRGTINIKAKMTPTTIAAIFLNQTIYGRYLLALGRNENAARFSGINTDKMTISAYMICSLLGGFGGMLFALDQNSVQPSTFGNFYELYAIAGAVLGGCSLRGGEGAITGVICGTAMVEVIKNAVFFLNVATESEFTVIGLVILTGVTIDELIKRFAAKQRATQQVHKDL